MKEWHIWQPSDKHPHWAPDEQTYAIKPPGYYNSETHDLIDKTIPRESFDKVVKALELCMEQRDYMIRNSIGGLDDRSEAALKYDSELLAILEGSK